MTDTTVKFFHSEMPGSPVLSGTPGSLIAVLDAVLHAYLEEHQGIADIAAGGVDANVVRDIVRRIKLNEYKRKQAPLGIKVTTKAFGPGRRYPVVQGFLE